MANLILQRVDLVCANCETVVTTSILHRIGPGKLLAEAVCPECKMFCRAIIRG